jgi:hypothetical protein
MDGPAGLPLTGLGAGHRGRSELTEWMPREHAEAPRAAFWAP